MTSETGDDALVLTGGTCPAIFNDIDAHLGAVAPGETVKLIASAGEQVASIARGLKADGHTIIGTERDDDSVSMTVRRQSGSPSDNAGECCPGGSCR